MKVLIPSLVLVMVLLPAVSSAQWIQVGLDIDGEEWFDQSGVSVALSSDGSRVAIGAALNDGGGYGSGHVRVFAWDGTAGIWAQLGQDIDGEAADDGSGFSVGLSSDGSRVAIGATYNGGNGANSGHVRVFEWHGALGLWVQLGSDINGEATGDHSGSSVALSSDGSRVAIGAVGNDGSGSRSGHVRVYRWISSSWLQVGPDIDGEAANDGSGTSVALSSDGSRVAVGAEFNDGNGNLSGHVRIYQYHSMTNSWLHVGQDIDGEAAEDYSGRSVALSSDGSRVAIGATSNDDNGGDSGHVRIYEWISPSWVQVGSDIDGEAAEDSSGYSVALSSDGSRVAIGAPWNDGSGNLNSGHVRVYEYSPWPVDAWLHFPDLDGEAAEDWSGISVALSSDGSRVAVGAPNNDSAGDNMGHVRVYSLAIFADSFESGNTSAWSATVP